MKSFGETFNAVVIGASGGIGRALVDRLASTASVSQVFACSRRDLGPANEKITALALDDYAETSLERAAAQVADAGAARLVIVATGILHTADGTGPEKSWNTLSAGQLADYFLANTIAPTLAAKHFLPRLPRQGKSVFAALSARVGSIEDNRLGGWHGYRASKAALNMLLKTLSIELGRRKPEAVCIGLHPGTVDTALSKDFQANVPEGKLFTPDFAAERLLNVVDEATPELSGQIIAWDGQIIPA